MEPQRITFNAMASACEIVIAHDDTAAAHRAAQAAIAEVHRIEARFSRYRADSIISQINAHAGQRPVACDDETWGLLSYAHTLFETSDGLFDITCGILRRAWNFSQARVPSTAELASLCALIDWPSVERVGHTVRLPRVGMEIDFGGFGKEYAADRAGAILATHGMRHGYVNLAGDMRIIGPKPDGQAWMIGIQDPRRQGQILATIPVHHGGLTTSGDYERYFELDGQRYCHILDPHSGMPVTHWRTVSVIAPLAVVAGNCTTIAMLKQAQGLAFLESTGMNFLAVDQNGALHVKGGSPA